MKQERALVVRELPIGRYELQIGRGGGITKQSYRAGRGHYGASGRIVVGSTKHLVVSGSLRALRSVGSYRARCGHYGAPSKG